MAAENDLPDRPQRIDGLGQVAVDRGVRHPFDVQSERGDLEVAAAVVVGGHATAVPRQVVDLDIEAVLGEPEIGVDDRAVGELDATLPLQRRKPTPTHGALEPELVVRIDRLAPHLTPGEHLAEAGAPGPAVLAQTLGNRPHRRDREHLALDALLDQRLEVVAADVPRCVEGGARW
jgi:hypothetical protein